MVCNGRISENHVLDPITVNYDHGFAATVYKCVSGATNRNVRVATRSIASLAPLKLLTLTFDISHLLSRRSWEMPGGFGGYRAAPARRPLTPGQIFSLPVTGRVRLFISFF